MFRSIGFLATQGRSFVPRDVLALHSLLSIEAIGTKAADDSEGTPDVDGWVVALTFADMVRRDPVGDPVADFSTLAIVVQDPGFDADGDPTVVTRTVRGTLPLLNTYPQPWADRPATVAARTWCCNPSPSATSNMYYTVAGGTRGGSPPVHTSGTVSDGGVEWTFWAPEIVAGYCEQTNGADVIVYAALDQPIYAGSTIVSASIGAGAYQAAGVSSAATASVPVRINSSALPYERPVVAEITLPHLASNGSFDFEIVAGHPWGRNRSAVACVKMRAWDYAETTGSPVVTVSQPVLSEVLPLSGPAGVAVEVYRGTLNTSSIPRGSCFVEYEVYPWLGDPWISRQHGEGAQWTPATAYSLRDVVRNGANLYFVTTAGMSAGSGGPTGTGTGISDGSVVWSFFGSVLETRTSRNPQARHAFVNDPLNEYTRGYACFNDTGSNIGSPVIHSSAAAALAAKATDSYGSARLAALALRTFHNTPAAGKIIHDDVGGGTLFRLAGTHVGYGGTLFTIPFGLEWLRVLPDPAADVSTVIFSYDSTQANRACNGRHYEGPFTHTWATGTLIDTATDGVTAQLLPRCELVIDGAIATTATAGSRLETRIGLAWYRNCRLTTSGSGSWNLVPGNSRAHPVDVVGCAINGGGTIGAMAVIGNDIRGGATVGDPAAGWAYVPRAMNWVCADNRIQGGAGNAVLVGIMNSTGAVMTNGGWVAGNLIVTYSTSIQPTLRISADVSVGGPYRRVTISNVSCIGARTNGEYNDLTDTSLKKQFYWQNTVLQTCGTVSSYFAHAGSAKGIGRYQQLWATYFVGAENNVIFLGSVSGGTGHNQDTSARIRPGNNTSYGQAATPASQLPQFVNDKSSNNEGGPNQGADGDYRPAPGSFALGRATRQPRRFDLLGNVRPATGGAVGALEAA